jgi:hypothetical protein
VAKDGENGNERFGEVIQQLEMLLEDKDKREYDRDVGEIFGLKGFCESRQREEGSVQLALWTKTWDGERTSFGQVPLARRVGVRNGLLLLFVLDDIKATCVRKILKVTAAKGDSPSSHLPRSPHFPLSSLSSLLPRGSQTPLQRAGPPDDHQEPRRTRGCRRDGFRRQR